MYIFIRSYLEVNDTLLEFVKEHRLDASKLQDTESWVIVLFISVLFALTLFGVALIFIYYQKLFRLYRFQQNFINGFTHELKTPIASLRLYLDTFNRYELDRDEQLKYINYMIRDTERLTLNVNQILQIAKVEDKNFEPSFKKINAYQFIENFLKRNPHYFEEIKIKLVEPKIKNTLVMAEPDFFEMVIMNIVTNAIIYNKGEEAQLNISIESTPRGNLAIKFKDNGVGLEKTEFKKVFKKMYQVGKTTKGSGLGLYLSSSIMKIHKGKLSVESEGIGYGSTFIVTIPISRDII